VRGRPESASPDEARVAAEGVVEAADWSAFAQGRQSRRELGNTDTWARSSALRIPVWDFAGFVVGRDAEGDVFGEVPLNQTTLRRAPTDFASVDRGAERSVTSSDPEHGFERGW
jgi:hypothetical protein